MKRSLVLIILFQVYPMLFCLSGNPGIPGKKTGGPNPAINSILDKISADSLRSHIESLSSFGTRFMYAGNRKQVAAWIASKFLSYGAETARLDSFRVAGDSIPADSVWQYNVIATYPGTSAPGEVYILGAHHDSYAAPDPYHSAPGADDNASGCASVIEIARVIGESGFKPSSTIRFVTFAAEEMVGYIHYSGSIDMAGKAQAGSDDLRLVICNDMIANTTGPGLKIFGTNMAEGINAWAGELTKTSVAGYSQLNMVSGTSATSDAQSFLDQGYAVSGFDEFGLNPFYHTPGDTAGNCRMDLCYEVTRATGAILLNEQFVPVPRDLACTMGKSAVTIKWYPTDNDRISGYRIYRSEQPDTLFETIGEAPAPQMFYADSTAAAGKTYYYRATTYGPGGIESTLSNPVVGAIAPKSRDLLVVKDSKGGYNKPADSTVMEYYHSIFKNLGADISDASVDDSLNLGILGMYRKIFWLSNTYSDQPNSSFIRHREEVLTCLKNGGQLFLAGFIPSFLVAGNIYMQKTFQPDEDISRYFKIQQVDRKPNAALSGAYPAAADYDSLRVDSLKCPNSPVGHLLNVECITPSDDAVLIYRFNTEYDTTTSLGKMKGKPVGLEYLGTDYKLIILTVPLFYLDTADARKLSEFIAIEKFITVSGIEDPAPRLARKGSVRCTPNPARYQTTIRYYLPVDGMVTIDILSMTGQRIMRKTDGRKTAGWNNLHVNLEALQPGVYNLVVRSGTTELSGKLVVN